MVRSCHRLVRPENLDSPFIQSGKGLGAGYLMDQVPVDIQYAGTVLDLLYHVGVPYLVKKSFSQCMQFYGLDNFIDGVDKGLDRGSYDIRIPGKAIV